MGITVLDASKILKSAGHFEGGCLTFEEQGGVGVTGREGMRC